jgi:integrase
MASLQARHVRSCEIGRAWTTVADASDCTCPRGPHFHTVVRDGKRADRVSVGHNLRNAERALARVQVQEDEGSYVSQRRIRFDAWADQWVESLEVGPNTRRSYRSTMLYAKDTFGSREVRRLAPDDVKRMLAKMREAKLTDSTRTKHLRVLHACLASAIASGYAGSNPVAALPKSERPRPVSNEAAYFENDELPALFAALPEGVYRNICLVALKSGMRFGELAALTWGDVDLVGGGVHVRRSFTDGHLGLPKSRERRSVDLTADLVELLGAWWGELGKPEDDRLVFPGPTDSGYLSNQVCRKTVLYPAMKRAGIPRLGPTGTLRTFHSFRHTFGRVALENGRPLAWVSRHLGHSSVAITDRVYGHYGRAAQKREIEQLEGAFSV